MIEQVVKSFWMIPKIDSVSFGEHFINCEVYDKKFNKIYNKGVIENKTTVNQLLNITKSNFFVNAITGINNDYICAPIRSEDGMIMGYVIVSLSEKNNISLYKIITQLIANQIALLIETDDAKRYLRTHKKCLKSINIDYLTAKERQVYEVLVLGKSDCEISCDLKISKSTLRMHLHSIFNKFNVSSRAEAIAQYYLDSIEKKQQ